VTAYNKYTNKRRHLANSKNNIITLTFKSTETAQQANGTLQ